MRVLLVNTSERAGGAAIAASRLKEALQLKGLEAALLVRDKSTESATTIAIPQRLRLRWAFLWERLCIFVANGFSRDGLWAVDVANAGADITRTRAFREADIIHLHWVNQGLLSLRQIRKILASGKPVVWTMHDMWPCTAVCHHARDCERFHSHCHDCPQLLRPQARDLSWKVFEQKKQAYGQGRITFVACSRWLANEAQKSALVAGHTVVSIPNPFNPRLFHPASKTLTRRQLGLPEQRRLLLFACQKVSNVRKGFHYLLTALHSPSVQKWADRLTLVVVGQMSDQMTQDLPYPVRSLGYISDETQMAMLYQAVDLFVTASLEENLPNTIMEAMACGTPCVGFHIGGIPEMIDHQQNGYVARYRDTEDLAAGIDYVLSDHERLATAAAEKAVTTWSEEKVAEQYIQLYNTLTR